MGREAARNIVMILGACSKALGFKNIKQYFQNDGGTVLAPGLCFHILELDTSADRYNSWQLRLGHRWRSRLRLCPLEQPTFVRA